jgi:hypothetical protein
MSVKLIVVLSISMLISGCGGGGGSTSTPSDAGDSTVTAATSVDVFDGAAIGCTVSSNGVNATEVGNGKYSFASALDTGTVVTASGCTDSDTQSLLPKLSGVVQSGAVIISPITTLIVEAAIANSTTAKDNGFRTSARSISATALETAIAAIVKNLGLGSYEPTNPATANYVAAAKADTTGTATATIAMRIGLAISTLIKGVEVSAGSTDANTAVSAVSQAIVASIPVVDLTQATEVEMVMTAAQTIAPTVATVIQRASDAIANIVAIISSTSGDITIAIRVTTTVSEFLNTADETTITNAATISTLITTIVGTPTDTTPPVITLNGSSAISILVGNAYTELGATAADNVDTTVAVTPSGSVDATTTGSYTITYAATDAAGNGSSATRTVNVTDQTVPVITITGDNPLTIVVGATFTDPGSTVSDNIDTGLTAVVTGTVDNTAAGSYTLSYVVSDAAGNEATENRAIEVINPSYEFTFNDSDLTLYEGEYVHKFKIKFAEQFPVIRNLSVSVSDGSSATNNVDFELLTSEIVVLENNEEGFIKIKVLDDIFFEGKENINIRILADNGVERQVQIEIDDASSVVEVHSDIPNGGLNSITTVIDDTLVISGRGIAIYDLVSETTLASLTGIFMGGYPDATTDGLNHYAFSQGQLYQIDVENLAYIKLSESPSFVEWVSEIQIIGDDIFVIGGKSQFEKSTTTVMTYNLLNKSWSMKANLNQGRYGAATALVNEKLYVMGGNYSSDTVEVYDPVNNSWSFVSSNSELDSQFDTAISNGNYIYVTISKLAATTTVLRYTPLTDLWESFQIQTPSRRYQDSFLYKGRIYLVGGKDNTGDSNSLVSYYIGDN